MRAKKRAEQRAALRTTGAGGHGEEAAAGQGRPGRRHAHDAAPAWAGGGERRRDEKKLTSINIKLILLIPSGSKCVVKDLRH